MILFKKGLQSNAKPDPRVLLDNKQVSALKRSFGYSTQKANQEEKRIAHRLLKEVVNKNFWIGCDCQSKSIQPPILFPRKIGETLSLVRMSSSHEERTQHAVKCPFRFTSEQVKNFDSNRTHQAMSGDVGILKNTKGIGSKTESCRSESGSSSSNRLSRVLWTVIAKAGLDEYHPRRHQTPKEQYTQLKQSSQTIYIDKKSDVALSPFNLLTYLPNSGYEDFLERLKKNAWRFKHTIAPQGYIITVVDDVHNNRIIHEQRNPIGIDGSLTSFAPSNSAARPPYLIIGLVGHINDHNDFGIVRLYAHPVVAKNRLIPVDSHLERQLAYSLIKLCDAYPEELYFVKPITNYMVTMQDGEYPCRPDFIIKNKLTNKCVVIELMGYENEKYLAQKAITHPRMKKLGPLIEVHADECVLDDHRALKQRILRSVLL